MDAIQIDDSVKVPAEALAFKAVRAGGPGGQNVNKVSSKVELRVDLRAIEGLHPAALERLGHAVRNQLDADGWWIVLASSTRDQGRNLEEAREKVRAAILKAMVPPTPRRPTRPTRASQKRRLEDKRRAGERKRVRGPSSRGED
jgi:ribosome-associated protein